MGIDICGVEVIWTGGCRRCNKTLKFETNKHVVCMYSGWSWSIRWLKFSSARDRWHKRAVAGHRAVYGPGSETGQRTTQPMQKDRANDRGHAMVVQHSSESVILAIISKLIDGLWLFCSETSYSYRRFITSIVLLALGCKAKTVARLKGFAPSSGLRASLLQRACSASLERACRASSLRESRQEISNHTALSGERD